MTELGEKLKQARLNKSLSLEEIQASTKIQKRYLKAIEEGNFDIIPGKFYVRAFIKQYAEAVGIPTEEVLSEYKLDVPIAPEVELNESLSKAQVSKNVSKQPAKWTNILPKVLVGVVVIVVLFLIYLLISKYTTSNNKQSQQSMTNESQVVQVKTTGTENKSAENKNKTTENQQSKDNESNQQKTDKMKTKEKQQDNNQKLSVKNASGRNTSYTLTNTNQFKLSIKATQNAWVQVKNAQGSTLYLGTLNKGDSKDLDVTKEDQVVITTGNSPGTDIYINKKKLAYKTNPQNQIIQVLTIAYKSSK